MTPQFAKEFLPLIKALSEDKMIQMKDDNGEWHDIACPKFIGTVDEYRVKPQPIYKPYDAETLIKAIKVHGNYIRKKDSVIRVTIDRYNPTIIGFSSGMYITYNDMVNDYVWADDESPCGVKVDAQYTL